MVYVVQGSSNHQIIGVHRSINENIRKSLSQFKYTYLLFYKFGYFCFIGHKDSKFLNTTTMST
jgi:hypothetical protein